MTTFSQPDPGGEPAIHIETRGERSVAAYSLSGTVFTGDIRAPVVLPEPSQVPSPAELHNLPRPVQASFMGRSRELRKLEEAVRAGHGPATQVVTQAVAGLGGIGKSMLALHYAHAHRREYSATWWVAAQSPDTITASLANLARRLLPRWDTSSFPDDDLATWALAWLQQHPGWLLVFDNATHPDHLAPYLAQATSGACLITSRLATGWRRVTPRPLLRLDVLPIRPATRLLLHLAERGTAPEERSQARVLAKELGCFPLALTHAGVYIARIQTTFAGYCDLFRAQPKKVFSSAGDPDTITIARTWRITLDVLADRHPYAVGLLRVLAWLGPDRLARDVVTGNLLDAAEINDGIAHLADFSMITLDEYSITTHRLVQALARTPDPDDPHRQASDIDHACDLAAAVLAQAIPDGSGGVAEWPRWRALQPHIEAHITHRRSRDDTPDTAFVLHATADFLLGQGQVAQAIAYGERALTARTDLYGPDARATLVSRGNLANAYQAAGDIGRAMALLEQTLEDSERLLGSDHQTTLASRNNLARAYEAAGDLGRAIPLFEQVLEDHERVLGPDHQDTPACRNNLAHAYRSAGNLSRAIPLFRQTIANAERVLGPDHPQTLASRNNLANTYAEAGDLKQAISLFEHVLKDRERVLGPDHVATLSSRNNLAGALLQAGDLSRATRLYTQTLKDRERLLGPNHPHTLNSRNNLANAYQEAGDLERATRLFEQTLEDRERVLGPDHPDTLGSRSNLASAYRSAGDLDRAAPLFEQLLAHVERVLGPDNPGTLNSRNNLAGVWLRAGDVGRAIRLYEQILRDRERVLGPDHPDTLTSRNNLANAYFLLGDLNRAIRLSEQTVADSERVLGPDHPRTLAARNNLAGAWVLAGDPAKGVRLFAQSVAVAERVLGPDHPDTLTYRTYLANAYKAMGDPG
ncbi:tetratricopeptide repeat protein [Kitasatospora acidiphila]|uniref:Tetratricopeptide repeat protein n=1 Tax=Kitasatospora acidiphila TaxID=2567942 RepID=A0A540VXG4_9ACTN|nr:tetratricopeptide repeat protein [Kitasatospora acidiphila]TQF01431.1 tetratricopeptide repeat protein [Kitasatospora acidiphila]